MIPYIILITTLLAQFVALPNLLKSAGEDSWKGYVPVLNWLAWLKVIKKPWWWLLLLLVPGVNLLMLIIMHVLLARSFDHREKQDTWLAILVPFYYLPNLALKVKPTYVGPIVYDENNPKTKRQEWGDAILFAIVAATIIRTLLFEAFTIPTPSMEKSMMVGDYLFVSKVSYGPRLPNTPISTPFTHHTIPGLNVKSYTEWFKLPYFRLPGLGSVERNDVMVFNFPEGDTVLKNLQSQNYHQLLRSHGKAAIHDEKTRMGLDNGALGEIGPLLVRPVDKRENYIKRCVAIPGDVVFIENGQLHINGQVSENYPTMQFTYAFKSKRRISPQYMKEIHDINEDVWKFTSEDLNVGYVTLSDEVFQDLKAIKLFEQIDKINDQKPVSKANDRDLRTFPNDPKFNWTADNFGPLTIPKKGETVALTTENLPLYRRLIDLYEDNTLEVKGGEIYINGNKADSYTFKMDYYWLMGDNRHNSLDSRFWGFVPEDHVVGKAVFIWFSKDPETGVRWDRVFSVVD